MSSSDNWVVNCEDDKEEVALVLVLLFRAFQTAGRGNNVDDDDDVAVVLLVISAANCSAVVDCGFAFVSCMGLLLNRR